MLISKNASLKRLNGFKTNITAKRLIVIENPKDIRKIDIKEDFFILGKGFNTLFATKYFKGDILNINIKGIKVIKEKNNYVYLKIGAGEDWINLVKYCVNKNWGGIENLAYIPGTVGAAVVQNIAAYGGNLQDVLIKVKTIDTKTKKGETYLKKECDFGYRTSLFKKEKNKIITYVYIKLSKKPKINTNYFEKGIRKNSIKEYLQQHFKKPYKVKDIAKAITDIRKSKLPEPNKIPSCGSFFLNPIISKKKYNYLKKRYSDIQAYPPTKRLVYTNNIKKYKKVKISAGQLLDKAGWRGKWIKNCGCYHKNAAIVVTNKKATGEELLKFTKTLKRSIKSKFNIDLKEEVVIVN